MLPDAAMAARQQLLQRAGHIITRTAALWRITT